MDKTPEILTGNVNAVNKVTGAVNGVQLSLAVGAVSWLSELNTPLPKQSVAGINTSYPLHGVKFWFGRLLNVGATPSFTVMLKEHSRVLPILSVAIYFTGVVPGAKLLPLATFGPVRDYVNGEQASEMLDGAVQNAVVPAQLAVLST